jgi:hypothetical protein
MVAFSWLNFSWQIFILDFYKQILIENGFSDEQG